MVKFKELGLSKQIIIFDLEEPIPIQIINGIKFTPREIDILASILSGRSAKVIASFLNISLKTLETHIHNLMLKCECNSRESIRALLENSHQVIPLRNHYLNLRLQEIFKKSLKKTQLLLKGIKPACLLIYPQTNMDKENGAWVLKGYMGFQKFFQQLGINCSLKPMQDRKNLVVHIKDTWLKETKKDEWYFYFIDEPILTSVGNELGEDFEQNVNNKNIFLLLPSELSALKPNEGNILGNRGVEKIFKYPFLWLDILTKMFPEVDLKEIIQDFKAQYDDLLEKNYYGVREVKGDFNRLSKEALVQEKSNNDKFLILQKVKVNQPLRYFLLSIVGILLFLALKEIAKNAMPVFYKNKEQAVHSELLIPNEAILLKRPYLIKQIEKKFKSKEGIQTVVLVGIGGAGKTTLGRYYGRLHSTSIVWELNAETHQSLVNSLKNLAYACARTKEKKEALDFIQNIQEPDLREKQLLAFIKERLKEMPDWLLIYDGVEVFEDIKDYFPHDEAAWGRGKVIITTQDKNIRNVASINPKNIVQVEALNASERSSLFKSIIGKDDPTKAWKHLHQMPADFLSHIPPFPLDVKLAAYYIKDIQVSYGQYLEKLYNPDASFEATQQAILKSIGSYNKTRYTLVVSAFNKILAQHPEFKDLMLFICLLNPNCIPKSLLTLYKGHTILEALLRPLRQYYLIATDPYPGGDAIYRLELSTQKLGLEFLLNLMNDREKVQAINKMIVTLKKFQANIGTKSTEHGALMRANIQRFMHHLEVVNLPKDIRTSLREELKLMGC